jgi:hypothetical protein
MMQNDNAWVAVVLIDYLFSQDSDKKKITDRMGQTTGQNMR